jgi:hypothetical protein
MEAAVTMRKLLLQAAEIVLRCGLTDVAIFASTRRRRVFQRSIQTNLQSPTDTSQREQSDSRTTSQTRGFKLQRHVTCQPTLLACLVRIVCAARTGAGYSIGE